MGIYVGGNLVDEPSSFDFGKALYALMDSKRVAREGWDEDVFIVLRPNDEHSAPVACISRGGLVSVWLPSQEDMFAEDWIEI